MHEHVGKQIDRTVLQNCAVHHRCRLHQWRVAQGAPDIGKEASPALGRLGRVRHWSRTVCKPHQDLELLPIREDVEGIVELLVPEFCCIGAHNIVWFGLLWTLAVRVFFCRGGECLIRDSHLDVVGFPGEDRD